MLLFMLFADSLPPNLIGLSSELFVFGSIMGVNAIPTFA